MTNKTITLTIPNDDPIALHEFGAAMQRMAHSHGHPVHVSVRDDASLDKLRAHVSESSVAFVECDTDKAQLAALGAETPHLTREETEAIVEDDANDTGAVTEQPKMVEDLCAWMKANQSADTHLDSDGLPWDARIHASSKERNADDTWRARRKPSDMDAAQWAEYQGQVRTELRELMAVPVMPVEQEVAAVLDEPVEPTPVVVEPVEPEPVVVTPPPVVVPPAPVEPVAPVAPPAPTSAAPTEFVPFLQWVTGNGYTAEQVNAALLPHGLTAVPQLQQRPDLIPQVYATLIAGM